jgi:hypothetical protein
MAAFMLFEDVSYVVLMEVLCAKLAPERKKYNFTHQLNRERRG